MILPGSLSFYPDEIERIEDAQLILIGISPSDLEHMSQEQRYDVLEISKAQRDPRGYLGMKPSL